jgi:hypothetical protein
MMSGPKNFDRTSSDTESGPFRCGWRRRQKRVDGHSGALQFLRPDDRFRFKRSL